VKWKLFPLLLLPLLSALTVQPWIGTRKERILHSTNEALVFALFYILLLSSLFFLFTFPFFSSFLFPFLFLPLTPPLQRSFRPGLARTHSLAAMSCPTMTRNPVSSQDFPTQHEIRASVCLKASIHDQHTTIHPAVGSRTSMTQSLVNSYVCRKEKKMKCPQQLLHSSTPGR
jgi:hypothetical protein